MSSSSATLIDLLRHGEPVGGRRYRGRRDDPLSEKGWQQMRAAVGTHRPWQSIVSSTLIRCSAFAKELATKLDVPLRTDSRLEELGFGEWEGCTADELNRLNAGQVDRFLADPIAHRPPGPSHWLNSARASSQPGRRSVNGTPASTCWWWHMPV